MTAYENIRSELKDKPKVWLVTGAAGFIGSNLVETLLRLNQAVRGLDSFATGHKRNLAEIKSLVTPDQWARFVFRDGDIRELQTCQGACQGADYVLHQAALGSVPRSVEDPLSTNAVNVTGCLNMLLAARDARVKRFVYASSSAIYGDHPALPKVEDRIGQALSPYAASKQANELYAAAFSRCYDLPAIGLRYFNVFGPRQDPAGPYAAVIPKWTVALMKGEAIYINGDGETSRDFCYVANVVQANILAATSPNSAAWNQAYNVALNERTSLNQLYQMLRERLAPEFPPVRRSQPIYRDFRPADVRHSQADISKAQTLLGYVPSHRMGEGLDLALDWYKRNLI
jgi:UDP-N-acetylglucosamine 4-epimerase